MRFMHFSPNLFSNRLTESNWSLMRQNSTEGNEKERLSQSEIQHFSPYSFRNQLVDLSSIN